MHKLEELINENIRNNTFFKAIISSPIDKKNEIIKLEIKPYKKDNTIMYQITSFDKKKGYHKNYDKDELVNIILEVYSKYKQMFIIGDGFDYQILKGNNEKIKIIKNKNNNDKKNYIQEHNRNKEYIIEENSICDFLVELGVMNKEGKVITSKYDKFRQINRYLEFVRDSLKSHKFDKIKVVDFGSGKAYLTFALYYYLVKILNIDAEIYGVDLKKDVIEFCSQTAKKLSYNGLKFVYGDIKSFDLLKNADFVITLHACDNATDDAIIQALKWNAKIIMCVPCCQHEFFSQIKNEEMNGILKHGIHKEKIASIITDSVRGLVLEAAGYDVKIMEFIDMEHTPKNILIRAVKKDLENIKNMNYAKLEYKNIVKNWGLKPYIEMAYEKEFKINLMQ